jgi:hypothetical protein
MTSEPMASTPVMPMSSRPTSLSFRNGRGGAFSKTRLIPFESAEKMPSALHARKPKLMMVMLPRDSMTASMTPVTTSASMGVPACTCSTTKSRASPSPRKYDPTTMPRTRSWKMERTAK